MLYSILLFLMLFLALTTASPTVTDLDTNIYPNLPPTPQELLTYMLIHRFKVLNGKRIIWLNPKLRYNFTSETVEQFCWLQKPHKINQAKVMVYGPVYYDILDDTDEAFVNVTKPVFSYIKEGPLSNISTKVRGKKIPQCFEMRFSVCGSDSMRLTYEHGKKPLKYIYYFYFGRKFYGDFTVNAY